MTNQADDRLAKDKVSLKVVHCLLHSIALSLRNTRHDFEAMDSAGLALDELDKKIRIVASHRNHFGFSDSDAQQLLWAIEALKVWVNSPEYALSDPLSGPSN